MLQECEFQSEIKPNAEFNLGKQGQSIITLNKHNNLNAILHRGNSGNRKQLQEVIKIMQFAVQFSNLTEAKSTQRDKEHIVCYSFTEQVLKLHV